MLGKAPDPADFSRIRRLEAVSFRSFPATNTSFDGTWAIRLTAGHPAKRLNSINPLDPDDCLRLEERIELAKRRFESFGRPLLFRLTPLAPPPLVALLNAAGWQPHEESLVMEADLAAVDLDAARDQLPLRDVGKWVDAFITLSGADGWLKPGLAEIIGATEPETGLFLHLEADELPVSVVRCVHDRDLAGIFDLATHSALLRRGHGREILKSALRWCKRRGARRAWLQVVADNPPAIGLYASLGFRETYRYRYWISPSAQPISPRV